MKTTCTTSYSLDSVIWRQVSPKTAEGSSTYCSGCMIAISVFLGLGCPASLAMAWRWRCQALIHLASLCVRAEEKISEAYVVRTYSYIGTIYLEISIVLPNLYHTQRQKSSDKNVDAEQR